MDLQKTRLEDLALFGGRPAFDGPIHVGRPNIGDRSRLLERVNDILDRKWLTNNGPYVQELEQRIADIVGVEHCVAVCNGTVALEILAHATGLTGEVIIPSMTFIATAHALQWLGITPIFCDVDPQTHNIDPRQVELLITPRTSAILGVHLWGRPCDIDALADIAGRHNLKLLFDAAHGFGSSYKGKMLGNFGNAEMFSFHATKFFNTLEGGALVTNDADLAQKMRLMKNFGFAGYDQVVTVGTNGKMNEVSAAMGLTGLESLNAIIATNRLNYETYRRELAGVSGIQLCAYDQAEQSNYQYIVAEVDAAITGITRDELLMLLHSEHVLARRYFYPGCHRMEPYRSAALYQDLDLPQTEELVDRVLILPTGTAMDERSIATVCTIIRVAVSHGQRAHDMLKASAPVH